MAPNKQQHLFTRRHTDRRSETELYYETLFIHLIRLPAEHLATSNAKTELAEFLHQRLYLV